LGLHRYNSGTIGGIPATVQFSGGCSATSERTQPAGATMVAMKNLDRRLARLEDRLTLDFARDPRQRLRVVVCNLGRTLSLETSTCRRMLNADGFLTEVVRLDGARGGLTDQEMEKFVEGFPIETI